MRTSRVVVSILAMQVLRGYFGDRDSKQVFKGNSLFDVLGEGYQRPFELATLRLENMINILPKCRFCRRVVSREG